MNFRFYGYCVVAIGVASSLLFAACKTTGTGARLKAADSAVPNGLDVTDVSVLFARPASLPNSRPEDSSDLFSPDIRLTDLSAIDNQEIMPDSVFASINDFVAQEIIGTTNPFPSGSDTIRTNYLDKRNWRIVAFRFDPCNVLDGNFHGYEDGVADRCLVQLRLVAQPIIKSSATSDFDVEDKALHLNFTLEQGWGGEKSKKIIQQLQDLKQLARSLGVVTSGMPLGVHPALVTELNQAKSERKFAAALKDFIRTNVSGATLTHVAAVYALVQEPWFFFFGQVKDQTWTALPIPNLGGTAKVETFLGVRGGLSVPQKIDSNFLNIAPMMKNALGKTGITHFSTTDQDRVKFSGIVAQIEDPRQANILNLDCVSCHISTEMQTGLSLPVSPDRYRPAPNVSGYAYSPGRTALSTMPLNPAQFWNTKVFSYEGGVGNVSMRAVNETASVVDLINQKILNLPNSGMDCSLADQTNTISECLFRLGGVDCFKKCSGVSDSMELLASRDVPESRLPDIGKIADCDVKTRKSGNAATLVADDSSWTITMGDKDATCFAEVFKGPFEAGPVKIGCETADQCSIVLGIDNGRVVDSMQPDDRKRLYDAMNFLTGIGGGVLKAFNLARPPSGLLDVAFRCIAKGSCSISVLKDPSASIPHKPTPDSGSDSGPP